MGKLTNRQKRFIDEYLISWNASDAARRAGYTSKPNVIGSQLLANISIKAAIHDRMEESAMKADENLRRLADQARLNITDFIKEKIRPVYDSDGNQVGEVQTFEINWEELKRRGHLIESLTNTQWGPRIEVYDAQAALFKIGTALGALTERVDVHSKTETVNMIVYLPDNGRSSSD